HDIDLAHPSLESTGTGLDLGQHAARDDPLLGQRVELRHRHASKKAAVPAANGRNIREKDQLDRMQGRGHLARHEVRVDIEKLAVWTGAEERQYGHEAVLLEEP